MKKKDLDNPTFIYRDGMTADKDYVQWLHEVKLRYRQSQVKAAVRVNTAMLEFYWGMGRDIVAMQAEVKWGSGFFNQLSLDMKAEFPNETGFSVTNLKYMKRWYDFYYQHVAIRQQTVDELQHLLNGRWQIFRSLSAWSPINCKRWSTARWLNWNKERNRRRMRYERDNEGME
ncbi:MAG: hypothetical protein J5900_00195 [Prevotella sp.]|nr:hypothetical protein [Prevotella sp.]